MAGLRLVFSPQPHYFRCFLKRDSFLKLSLFVYESKHPVNEPDKKRRHNYMYQLVLQPFTFSRE